jgi:hypothetical protein
LEAHNNAERRFFTGFEVIIQYPNVQKKGNQLNHSENSLQSSLTHTPVLKHWIAFFASENNALNYIKTIAFKRKILIRCSDINPLFEKP